MMKKNKILIILSIILITFTGCNDYFKDLQEDPNSPSKGDLASILTSAMYDQLNREGGFSTGRIGVFTQHYAGNHANAVSWDQYVLNDRPLGGYMTGAYIAHLKDYSYIIEEGNKGKNYHYVGVAKIMTALSLAKISEIFGDIPWSEALNTENDNPKYDNQTDIYTKVQSLITEGITDLGKTSSVPLKKGDFVYDGNTEKWIAIAHAISARYYNNLGNYEKALDEVQAAKDAGFTSNENSLKLPFDGVKLQGGWFHLYKNGQLVASKLFMDYLNNENDPRKSRFFNDISFSNDTIGYKGKPNGFGASNENFSDPGSYFASQKSYTIIFPYYELLFIEAEAKFKNSDNSGAATALNEAVKSSVEEVAEDNATLKNNYYNSYASFNASTVTERHIMTEKWKAMHCLEPETWTDMRRYGYKYPVFKDGSKPELHVRKDGTEVSNKFVERLLYPQSELDRNPQPQHSKGIFDKLIFSKKTN